MAAGQGFKTFTTGEVLTAGDVNGYLMQGVLVFASAAARNAAITSPQEGQFAYTKDTNGLWYYDGAAWVASGATGDIEGVSVTSPITGGGTSGTVTIGIDSTAVVPSQTGNSGKYLTTNGTVSSWATVSSGATSWTLRKKAYEIFGVATFANGLGYFNSLWWIWGSGGKLAKSSDGINWTSVTSGFGTSTIRGFSYGNGIYVAVGNSGVMTTSTDGVTFTARTSSFGTTTIYDVVYGNGVWVASGNTNKIGYSTDAITWTNINVGASGWTVLTYLSSSTVFTIYGAGEIYTSTNGSTWTSRTWPAAAGYQTYQAKIVNGVIYASTDDSNVPMIQSSNGTTFTATSNPINLASQSEIVKGTIADIGNGVGILVTQGYLFGVGMVPNTKYITKFIPSNVDATVLSFYDVAFPITQPTGRAVLVASDGAGKILCSDYYCTVVTNF